MRYIVFGAGAIGGTVGAYLARAGEAVLFVDRDADHVQAMRARGLTIRAFDETFTVPVEATTPVAAGPARGGAAGGQGAGHRRRAGHVRRSPGADGYVVSLQNGLNERLIAAQAGAERTIGAFVNFSADYLEPGLIHFAGRGTFQIGELDGQISPRLLSLQQALSAWGNVQTTDNIWGFLWGKQAYGAMLFATALSNDSMADAIDGHRRLMIELAREVLAVAAALGFVRSVSTVSSRTRLARAMSRRSKPRSTAWSRCAAPTRRRTAASGAIWRFGSGGPKLTRISCRSSRKRRATSWRCRCCGA